jgi:hypothetical protein
MSLQEVFCAWCKYGLNCKENPRLRFEECPKQLLDEAAASAKNGSEVADEISLTISIGKIVFDAVIKNHLHGFLDGKVLVDEEVFGGGAGPSSSTGPARPAKPSLEKGEKVD